MKTSFPRLFLVSLAISANVVACATADEEPEVVVPPAEVGSLEDTSNPTDSSAATDSAPGETLPDAGPDAERCVYPATDTKKCGKCGTQTRFCLPEGLWTGFTACSGEIAEAECSIGQKQTADCGNCGKATDFCDPSSCTWIAGLCSGEGECAPGEEGTTSASCSDPSEVRKRTCDDKCAWSSFSSCAAPTGWLPMVAAPIPGRFLHTAVWTGDRMLVWGGSSASTTHKNDGAIYNLGSNTWTTMASSPLSARRAQAGVWTGSKLFIWGGYTGSPAKTGALYDPATDAWTAIPDGPLSARHSVVAAYSPATKEVLVWGGCTSGLCTAAAGDGAAYNTETNTWTSLPTAPITARADAAFAMLGSELVIWGGRSAATTMQVDGARFDPVTRVWTKFSAPGASVLDGRYDEAFVPTGTSLVIWGGRSTDDELTAKANGAIYTPMVGFTPIPPVSDTLFAPSGKRFDVAAFIGKNKLYIFSGIPSTANDLPKEGMVSYDLVTGSWNMESTVGAPQIRARASAVWTGKEAIIWGGGNGDMSGTFLNTGAIYRP